MTKSRILFVLIILVISHAVVHAQNARFVLGTNQSFHFDTSTQQSFTTASSSSFSTTVNSFDPLSNSSSYFLSNSIFIGVQFWEELELDFSFGYTNSTHSLTVDRSSLDLFYTQTSGFHTDIDFRYLFRCQSFIALYINGGFGVRMNVSTVSRYTTQGAGFFFLTAGLRTTDATLKEGAQISFEPYVPFGGGFTIRFSEYDFSRISIGYIGRFYITQQAENFGFVNAGSGEIESLTFKTPSLTHGIAIEYAYVF